jgi:hypothetical protein
MRSKKNIRCIKIESKRKFGMNMREQAYGQETLNRRTLSHYELQLLRPRRIIYLHDAA